MRRSPRSRTGNAWAGGAERPGQGGFLDPGAAMEVPAAPAIERSGVGRRPRRARALAQYPFAAILSCADSRVAPELAFDEGPGELFVVRVAGNFVNSDLLASLEYGVQFLGVPFILVLGHANCGAVDAAIKVLKSKAVLPGRLPDLVSAIKPAVNAAEKARSGDLLDAIAENVRKQDARLKASPPIVQKFYADRKIDIAGGVYDLATGKVALV
jgi:carbonic anhydrase